jgi:hypothetical protein
VQQGIGAPQNFITLARLNQANAADLVVVKMGGHLLIKIGLILNQSGNNRAAARTMRHVNGFNAPFVRVDASKKQ